ncbi:M3 family metallopeptidase [Deinococcus altitudinis]|uniref:M3 family metallopeptidase n=1 Tax=Deinococcus altitudinis TaxID=468914 RepID=UPI0038928C0F
MNSVQGTADLSQGDQQQGERNPLLGTQFLIPFDRIRPEHVAQATQVLIAEAREGLERLALAPQTGFGGFLNDLDSLTARLDVMTGVVGHLDSVVSDEQWRAARRAMLPLVSAFYTDLGMHAGLYAALKAFAATEEGRTLDPVHARFLNLSLDGFRRDGAELPPVQQARLKDLNIELGEVTSLYGSNSMDGISAYELYVPAERLAGVPERVQQATRVQEGEHAGQHRLTLHAPTYLPVMTYADDRALREELFRASNAVGTGEGRDNRELLPRILALRQEKAELLGYANYADYLLEDRMAGTGERAMQFETDLTERTQPAFERETAELEAFYHEQAGEDAPALAVWDTTYWAEKQRQALYALDDEELRPYFEITRVLTGLFEVARRIFGVNVQEAQAPVWHPEVRFYDMTDETGAHIASFYTDWFPRDSKRGGAWMNGLRVGGPTESGFAPHLGLMCGNLTPPTAGAPALLSHDEVETIFHEFGHLLHSSLSRVPVRQLAGTSVAWDFVELPSHIMENWTWNQGALALFARHHQTGEALPDELYTRMIRARNFRAASTAMRQYSLGTADLSLHTRYVPADGDILAYTRDIFARFQPVSPLPGDARIANFGHLFSSPVGYAAGYYSYKWAEVLDADAFTRFEREGVLNRAVGRAFVDAVLSRGNGAPAGELYQEFMGRLPDPQALLRRSGLA